MTNSLSLFLEKQLLFSSDAHWLYPLFELEDFLKLKSLNREDLYLKDKIAGRAAASLIISLGIRTCHIDLISAPAESLFLKEGINFTFDIKVEKIDCRTEDWIKDSWTLEETRLFLRKRAGRVRGTGLEVRNLSFSYGERPILQGLNLQISRGEQHIIEGENGAGKSTLLKILAGLLKPGEGEILIEDKEAPIGYLPQELPQANFPVSAGEVAAMGLIRDKRGKKEQDYTWEIALRQTGSFHLRNRHWDRLSGGEKQRISLARCLCQQARIFLIDEPTSYLDQSSKESLIEVLSQLSRDITPTILMVSHDRDWSEGLGWKKMNLERGRLC